MAKEYVIQGNYGESAGWEDLTVEDNRKDAQRMLADYRANEPQYQHRIKPDAGPGSYTAMSDEAIEATIRNMEATGEHYALTLNPSDFANLMHALQAAYSYGETDSGVPDWAGDFASGIAETLGVEMV